MCLTVYGVASFFFLCYWDCESNAVQCCAVLCCAVLGRTILYKYQTVMVSVLVMVLVMVLVL